MVINKTLGDFENIPTAEFGKGDILITKCQYDFENHASMIVLFNHDPRPIGETSEEFTGKKIEQMPSSPQMILEFSNPESITALVHSLIELQQGFFKVLPPV